LAVGDAEAAGETEADTEAAAVALGETEAADVELGETEADTVAVAVELGETEAAVVELGETEADTVDDAVALEAVGERDVDGVALDELVAAAATEAEGVALDELVELVPLACSARAAPPHSSRRRPPLPLELVRVAEAVVEIVGVAELVDELDSVGEGVLERVDELEIDGVSDAVLVVLSVGVAESDGELVRVGVDEGEFVPLTLMEGEGVAVAVTVAELELELLTLGEGVWVDARVCDGVGEFDAVATQLIVGVPVLLKLAVLVVEMVADALAEDATLLGVDEFDCAGDGVPDAVTDGVDELLGELVGESVANRLLVGEGVPLGVAVMLVVAVIEREAVTLRVGELEEEEETVGLGVAVAPVLLEGDGVAEGVVEAVALGVVETVDVGEGVAGTTVRLVAVSADVVARTPHVKPVPALTDCQPAGVTTYVRASVTVPEALVDTCREVKEKAGGSGTLTGAAAMPPAASPPKLAAAPQQASAPPLSAMPHTCAPASAAPEAPS
jgi:hypothetical protein